MKNAQIIDVLNIALLKIEPQIVFLCEEMDGIESFGLGFGYRWDRGGSGEAEKTCEAPSCVLNYYFGVVVE